MLNEINEKEQMPVKFINEFIANLNIINRGCASDKNNEQQINKSMKFFNDLIHNGEFRRLTDYLILSKKLNDNQLIQLFNLKSQLTQSNEIIYQALDDKVNIKSLDYENLNIDAIELIDKEKVTEDIMIKVNFLIEKELESHQNILNNKNDSNIETVSNSKSKIKPSIIKAYIKEKQSLISKLIHNENLFLFNEYGKNKIDTYMSCLLQSNESLKHQINEVISKISLLNKERSDKSNEVNKELSYYDYLINKKKDEAIDLIKHIKSERIKQSYDDNIQQSYLKIKRLLN